MALGRAEQPHARGRLGERAGEIAKGFIASHIRHARGVSRARMSPSGSASRMPVDAGYDDVLMMRDMSLIDRRKGGHHVARGV